MADSIEQSPSEIGKKLWTARQMHKMSLRDLAKAAEISASMLSQIETGKAFPSVRSLYKIASALDVSVDYFFPAQDGAAVVTANGDTVSTRDLTASQMREAMLNMADEDGNLAFPPGAKTPIVHASARPKIQLNSGITWERLTTNAEADTEFLEITYAPSAESGKTMSRHEGREFGLVLEGELVVELGFESHTLRPGDSIIFDSSTPHRLTNAGERPMRALWVVLNNVPG
jgi:transcriptional regulator with XRE-family HTH domain